MEHHLPANDLKHLRNTYINYRAIKYKYFKVIKFSTLIIFNIATKMSKIAPTQKELKINPELKKIIKEMLEKDAKLSQDKTFELVV